MAYRIFAYQRRFAEFKPPDIFEVAAFHGAVAPGVLQVTGPLTGALDLSCSSAFDRLPDDPRFEEI